MTHTAVICISNRIRNLRIDHNRTQLEVTKAIRSDRSQYSKQENGTRRISIDKLQLLALYFNIGIDYFFQDTRTDQNTTSEVTLPPLAPTPFVELSVSRGVAKWIIYYRKARKQSQKELAENISILSSTLSRYEQGNSAIPADVLWNMCKFYRIGINHFLRSEAELRQQRIKDRETS